MKIVITGGAYSGKTSLINELSKQGFNVFHESSFEYITELNNNMGVEQQKKWRFENFDKFIVEVGKRQILMEKNILSLEKPVFFDRGIYDCIAYCKVVGITPPEKLIEMAKGVKYDFIFLCDTLSDFDIRENTGRISDRNRSIKAKDLIEKTYKEYGFKVVHVKEMVLEKRVEFIKTYLNFP